jgi:hypothetical protein
MRNLRKTEIPASQNNYSVINTEKKLNGCQIETQQKVVKLLWDILHKYRESLGEVADFGAGDGRFALEGNYKQYVGVEVDGSQLLMNNLPRNAILKHGCLLDVKQNYEACIGNPPYYRHHAINSNWKEKAGKLIKRETGFTVNKLANLFIYFLWFSLIRSMPNGIVGVIVPYEWVSRPSCKSLREFIVKNNWKVDVYRFEDEKDIFPGVLTTSSITVIDKSVTDGQWNYFDIDKELKISKRNSITGTGDTVLSYENGGCIFAKRGFSPGSQKVFTLTNQERITYQIELDEVVPCVTSFREFPADITVLDKLAFREHFIDSGKKCWLLKTEGKLSARVMKYFEKIPDKEKNRYTCRERDIWYAYKNREAPKVLYSSGFIKFGPKMAVNKVGAVPLGSVHGIHTENGKVNLEKLVRYLRDFNFENRVVRHAKTLIKVEVKQMNAVINEYLKSEKGNFK